MKLKCLGRIFACMAVLMAMLLAADCQKSGNSSEESANAVLNQFLSGTVQDADGMEDYFQKQFGEIMTADCIADLLADRSMIAPMKLAQKLDKDIIAQDIQLTAKSGEDNAYDFSTQLVTSDDKQPVGTATGYVKMLSDNSTWKASALTIKITTN